MSTNTSQLSIRSYVPLLALITLCSGTARADLIFNQNVIQNPGAEQGLANWTVFGIPSPEAVAYGATGFPSATDPGPADRGGFFFAGGPNADFNGLTQVLDVSNAAALIDAGLVTYNLTAWQGGKDAQPANAAIGVFMYDAQGNFLFSNGTNFNNSAADRNDVTGLFFRPAPLGLIVPGTRSLTFEMFFMQGADNVDHYSDGYIDNVSFVAATSATPEPMSMVLIGSGLLLLGVTRKRKRFGLFLRTGAHPGSD